MAAVAIAVLVPPAFGAWTAPVDVQTVTSSGGDPQIATDADGDSALTYELDFDSVEARTLSDTGALGPVLALGPGDSPQVAIDAQGDAVFVWREGGVSSQDVFARRLSAGGTLGPLLTVSGPGIDCPCFTPQVATDANGDTVFTWVGTPTAGDQRIMARTMTARGVLGTAIRRISPAASQGNSQPQVATDDGGDSVITWVRHDGVEGDNDLVQARTMTINSSLGPVTDISAVAGRAFAPQVASDADGDSILTWNRFDGGRDRIQARTMSPGAALGATITLTGGTASAQDPAVAIDDAGDALFAWERFDTPVDRVQARTRSAAGTLGATTNMSSNNEAMTPQVASDADGDSVVIWVRFDGTVDRVQAKPMTAAGVFGGTSDLSLAGADAEAPQVSIASTTGLAAATWERGGTTIQAARGP